MEKIKKNNLFEVNSTVSNLKDLNERNKLQVS